MIYRKVHFCGKLADNDRSRPMPGQCRNIFQQSLRQIPNSHTSHPRVLKIQSDPKTRSANRLVSLAHIFDALHRSRSPRACVRLYMCACVSQFDRFTGRHHRACVHVHACAHAGAAVDTTTMTTIRSHGGDGGRQHAKLSDS